MDDLNDPKIAEFTRHIGETFGLDTSFINFVLADRKPSCFDFRCERADAGWTCRIPDDVDAAYPLWSSNADQTLLIVSQGEVAFAKGFHDEPTLDRISTTAQGLMARLFVAIYEDDVPTQELEDGAKFSGFRFLDECIQFQHANGHDYLAWNVLLDAFIADVDAKSQ